MDLVSLESKRHIIGNFIFGLEALISLFAIAILVLSYWDNEISKKIDSIKNQKEENRWLKQQKINEVLFKVSIYPDSYENKLQYADSLIQNEPILSDFDIRDFIETDTGREKSSLQKGLSHYISGSYDKALAIFKSILLDHKKTDFELAIVEVYIGKIYLRRPEPNLDQATKYLENSKKRFESINRSDEVFNVQKAQMFTELGVVSKRNGLKNNAKDFYEKSLTIFEKLNKEHPGSYIWDLAVINQNLYVLYSNSEELDVAFPFLKKALAYGTTNKIEGISDCTTVLNSISSAISYYARLHNFDEAESYFNNGLKIIEKCKTNYPNDHKIDLALASQYLNYADVPFEQFFLEGSNRTDLIESSINYATKALKIYEELIKDGQQFEHMIAVSNVHFSLGRANHVLGNYGEAIREANISIKILEQNFDNYLEKPGQYSTRLGHNYILLSRTHYQNGNLEAAKQNAQLAIKQYTINLKDNGSLQDFINQANHIINTH